MTEKVDQLIQLRADMVVANNKFAETVKIAELAKKYGVKVAGRQKMVAEVTKSISAQIRALVEASKNA
jgi:hypothetical protein